MHNSVQQLKSARRKARKKNGNPEVTEPEVEGEMDNFQDLQLGSLTPLVCLDVDFYPLSSSDCFLTEHGSNLRPLTPYSTSLCLLVNAMIPKLMLLMQSVIHTYGTCHLGRFEHSYNSRLH